jgi:crossover junction endodeoxyribonuclease RuvC
VVESDKGKKLQLVDFGIIRTDTSAPLHERLMSLDSALNDWIRKINPDAIAVERVFSQLNVKTAMATGQAAGIALLLAAKSGLPIALHTPTEVKAAVTGSGRADKAQVARMVVKILGLSEAPKPVDTTDALALAICHHWRGSSSDVLARAAKQERSRLSKLKEASSRGSRIKK